MEICILILLYYLSQNPAFAESVKPIMHKLKDSQRMLDFLNDLSKFTQTFGCAPNDKERPREKQEENCKKDEKNPQSPTAGIANDFIEQILESYLSKNVK